MKKVGVFILNYKRPDTIQKVVNSALHQTVKPEAIYVWNNNPEITTNFPGCININSQQNMRCIVRHAVALARPDIDAWVFIDDDVQMKPKTIENFLKYHEKYPEAILGYYGRNVLKWHLYSLSRSNWIVNREEEVWLVMGMIHFCKREKLVNSFIMKKNIPDLPMTEDDIILCLGNRYIDKAKNYIIPYDNESGTIPLSSKHKGLSASGGHLGRRKEAVKKILEWAGETELLPPKATAKKPTPTEGFKEV